MSDQQTHRKRNLLRWLPGVLISAVAIYAIIHFTRGQDFRAAFRSVEPTVVLLLLALNILSLLVRSIAWRTILGNKVSLVNSFFGISEGYFLNNLFPLRAGEIGRALFVGRSSGLGTLHVLSTILIERAFDIFFAAGIILLTLPLVIGSDWIKPIAFTAFIVVIAALFFLFFISINREKFQLWLEGRNFRSKFIQVRILPQINKIMDGMSALVHPGQFLLSIFWIAITWLTWVVLYYSTAVQISSGGPLWWGGFIAGLIALGVAIPSAPASVGVYEATLMGAFALLGITSASALAYAIILHLVQILVTTVFGLWGMIRDGQSFATLLDSVTNKKALGQQDI